MFEWTSFYSPKTVASTVVEAVEPKTKLLAGAEILAQAIMTWND